MCMAIYIAADTQLPRVAWNEESPAFHTSELKTARDQAVREQITKPYVVFAGSSQGCGCGFYSDDDELEGNEDSRQLGAYLSEAICRGSSVELYTCWEGEEGTAPTRRRVLTPTEISAGALEFGEPELVALRRESPRHGAAQRSSETPHIATIAVLSVASGPFWRRRKGPASESIRLRADGCYWFLGPFLDGLHNRTGRDIDPWRSCRFTGTFIVEFREVIAEALAAARDKPTTFEVEKPNTEILSGVNRDALIALLTGLDNLAAIAQRERRALVCEGEYALRQRGILTESQDEARLRAAHAAEQFLEGRLSLDECFQDIRDIDEKVREREPLVEDLLFHMYRGDRDAIRAAIEDLRRSVSS